MPVLNGQGTFNSAITLSVPPDMMEAIQQISHDSRLPVEAVITRAIALYQISLKAISEGKHVGYTSTDDRLEVEFTGLIAPEG
jgi:hypothetical protein